ncbi:SMP-30/gluconolactonase/LRE family protein [Hyphomonas sp.]|uniref:SMP-30/gluconolactonase/LRE family protein n=1 Tax=Hyphomonas sp. TaxID=87 RepID=UPI00391B2DBF
MSIQFEFLGCEEVGNALGEGVLWRESDQTVWWTDILSCRLYRMSWPAREVKAFMVPERLGSFGFVAGDDDCLVCAFETGFALFWPETAAIRWLSHPAGLQPKNIRMNDGKVAPDGRFWAGSMKDGGGKLEAETGFYRLCPKSGADLMIAGLGIPNGLAWAPSGEEFYFSDTVSGTVYSARVAADAGTVSATPFTQLAPGTPDGAAFDTAGRYWAALWDTGKIAVISADTAITQEFRLPVPRPTCIAFGGAERNIAFVTSARTGLDEDALNAFPLSGGLLIYQTNACGLTASRFIP